jgi:hypothetical protein
VEKDKIKTNIFGDDEEEEIELGAKPELNRR